MTINIKEIINKVFEQECIFCHSRIAEIHELMCDFCRVRYTIYKDTHEKVKKDWSKFEEDIKRINMFLFGSCFLCNCETKNSDTRSEKGGQNTYSSSGLYCEALDTCNKCFERYQLLRELENN